MIKLGLPRLAATLCLTVIVTACAVRPVPDPRSPGVVRDGPVTLRVCIVNGDGAHLAVGDQVELDTNRLGRLRIRHIPGRNNQGGAWNDGDDVRVSSDVLVERVAGQSQPSQRNQQARANQQRVRRFVPVGRFPVRLETSGDHARFDFVVSSTTMPTREHPFPECIADVGDDEVLIRGVEDDDRHGGHAILR